MSRRSLAIPLAVLALTLGAAGCGGGDDQQDLPPLTSTPELVPPTSTPTTSSTIPTTTTPGASDTIKVRTIEEAPSDGGGDGGGDGGSDEDLEPAPEVEEEQVPDNPKNDTPPKPDSSAERFEQFCASDPKACGN